MLPGNSRKQAAAGGMGDTNGKRRTSVEGSKASQAEEWPGTVRTRSALDAALEEGERSGRSSKTMRDVVEEVLGPRRGG